MARKYKKHSGSFKAQVALEAIRERKAIADLCQEHEVSASQVFAWKKQLEEQGSRIFEEKQKDSQVEIDRLHRVIGQLAAERDFLERVLKR